MAWCPKCGKKVKHKRKSTGLKTCSHCGPVEKKSERYLVVVGAIPTAASTVGG